MKERLKQAMKKQERVKLIFEYPKATKVKRGCVLRVGEDSFDFKDNIDGLSTYKYKYLVEITIIKNETTNKKQWKSMDKEDR